MAPFGNFIRAFTSPKAFFFYFVSAFAWLIIVAAIAVPSSFVLKHHYLVLGLGLGTALWLYGNGKLLKSFMVSVPEVTGLVTVNLLTGDMNAYGTGLGFRFPWEQVKDGNYINLRTTKTDDKQETFPCKDGPVVIVKWSSQYRSSVEQLPAYISVDEEIINKGLNEVASSFLTLKIRDMKSEEIREQAKKAELETDLFKHFRESATVPVGQLGGSSINVPLEEFYGISIKLVTIADVDFEKSYQQARSTDQIMKKYKQTAKHVIGKKGDGSITNKDALDSVLMVAGKGVKKDVLQETKVYDVSPALANVLKAAAEAFSRRQP